MEPAPAADVLVTTHQLVADFLKQHGYNDTLAALEREAGPLHHLPLQRQASLDLPLKDMVEQQLARQLAALSHAPAPLVEEIDKYDIDLRLLPKEVTQTVLDSMNVLLVQRGIWPERKWNSETCRFESHFTPCFFTSAVDRTVKAYSAATHELLATYTFPSPVLSVCQYSLASARFLVASTMQGSLHVVDLVTREIKVSLKDHNKYVTRVVSSEDGRFVATVGYDKQLHIYSSTLTSKPPQEALLEGETHDALAEQYDITLKLIHTLSPRTNPEAAVFLPSSSHLVYGCRDDYLLHYLRLPNGDDQDDEETWTEQTFNLNENGDTWVSFSPLYMSIHPTLPIVAISTSSIARVILYPFFSDRRIKTLYTNAAQSDYFQPRHKWLPDGNGLVVNSEDGIIRVVSLKGKVVLQYGAHGAASHFEDHEGMDANERVRIRREQEKGSSVVKDVEAYLEHGKVTILSVGFDKSIRIAR